MATLLTGIGRSGLRGSVRKLSGAEVPAWRKVDSDAEFIAGMVCKLGTDSSGNPQLEVIDGTDDNPIGIFYCHKTTSFYVPFTEEATSPSSTGTINLSHANIKSDSIRVENTSSGSAYTEDSDYSLNETNGILTMITIAEDTELTITYRYTDPNLSGVDQTLGSGKAAYVSDPCEIATIVYDTTRSYSIGDTLYATTDGLITNNNSGTTTATIGTVTKAPTASDPELYVRLRIS